MTSSLVGSEMCIRDSLVSRVQCISFGTDGVHHCPPHVTACQGVLAVEAVSYTHLTLPTICSV
eukprot:9631407-Prorocentrum_lima.AAC.1